MNDAALRTLAEAWLAEDVPAWIVRVGETAGSVPRHTGTRMLVRARSQPAAYGTVGGGHLEWQATDHARRLLMGEALPTHVHYPLGPALGQCCGGAVSLHFEPLSAETLLQWPEPTPRFHLQLYGAGHVGSAIARALEPLDVHVDWIDERDDAFPAAPSPAHIRRVAVDSVWGEVRTAPPGGFYLVLTHSHDLDLQITEAILKRADFAYLGLIGSATKRARFLHRFEARGVPAEVLSRMTCPIGLPGIVGKEPELIAASVVAQLLVVDAARQPASAVQGG
jgi:xanthine dehydrogenase accessory factor